MIYYKVKNITGRYLKLCVITSTVRHYIYVCERISKMGPDEMKSGMLWGVYCWLGGGETGRVATDGFFWLNTNEFRHANKMDDFLPCSKTLVMPILRIDQVTLQRVKSKKQNFYCQIQYDKPLAQLWVV